MAVVLAPCLLGCDPVYSLQGRVRSVSAGQAAQPLPKAQVKAICENEHHDLTVTNADGRYFYANVGSWDDRCELVVTTPDGRHEGARVTVRQLCDEAHEPNCDNVALEWDAVLERKDARPVARSIDVAFQAETPATRFYVVGGGPPEELCSPPCTIRLFAGEHEFAVGPTAAHAQALAPETLLADATIVGRYEEDPELRKWGWGLVSGGALAWLTGSVVGIAIDSKRVVFWSAVAAAPVLGVGLVLREQGESSGSIQVTPLAPASD